MYEVGQVPQLGRKLSYWTATSVAPEYPSGIANNYPQLPRSPGKRLFSSKMARFPGLKCPSESPLRLVGNCKPVVVTIRSGETATERGPL